jgi:hypothetical protein
MIKGWAHGLSTANSERLQVLPQKSFGMQTLTVLKYLGAMLKIIIDKLVQVTCLIQTSKKHNLEKV